LLTEKCILPHQSLKPDYGPDVQAIILLPLVFEIIKKCTKGPDSGP